MTYALVHLLHYRRGFARRGQPMYSVAKIALRRNHPVIDRVVVDPDLYVIAGRSPHLEGIFRVAQVESY